MHMDNARMCEPAIEASTAEKEKLEEQIAALRGVAGALVGGVLCASALLGCNLMGEILRSSGGPRGQRAA